MLSCRVPSIHQIPVIFTILHITWVPTQILWILRLGRSRVIHQRTYDQLSPKHRSVIRGNVRYAMKGSSKQWISAKIQQKAFAIPSRTNNYIKVNCSVKQFFWRDLNTEWLFRKEIILRALEENKSESFFL